jgi:hypothetical protein
VISLTVLALTKEEERLLDAVLEVAIRNQMVNNLHAERWRDLDRLRHRLETAPVVATTVKGI